MNTRTCSLALTVFAFLATIHEGSNAQDSLATHKQTSYGSFGFQGSFISGTGITGGYTQNGLRMRVTFGLLKSADQTDYSFGIDMHFILATKPQFQLLVGPSFGEYGSSGEKNKPRIALATCLESPLLGKEFRDNICAGIVLYYPAYYFVSSTLNPTGGIYLIYNF